MLGGSLELSLSDFVIDEELFRSMSGAVYLARTRRRRQQQQRVRTSLPSRIVLKERRSSELGHGHDIMNEVHALERMQHPNIIKTYGHFFHQGSLFLILEYAPGGDLHAEVVRRQRSSTYFTEEQIWSIILQICHGLGHMHAHGVIHRDLKSLNLLITGICKRSGTYTVKIGDLGVCRSLSDETLLLHTFYGTPLYASPEICENQPYDSKTDMWSLGVVLYELAALKTPFQGPSLISLARAIVSGQYAPLPPYYSSTLSRVVSMLLQPKPEQRPNVHKVLRWFDKSKGKHQQLKEPHQLPPGSGAAVHSESVDGPSFTGEYAPRSRSLTSLSRRAGSDAKDKTCARAPVRGAPRLSHLQHRSHSSQANFHTPDELNTPHDVECIKSMPRPRSAIPSRSRTRRRTSKPTPSIPGADASGHREYEDDLTSVKSHLPQNCSASSLINRSDNGGKNKMCVRAPVRESSRLSHLPHGPQHSQAKLHQPDQLRKSPKIECAKPVPRPQSSIPSRLRPRRRPSSATSSTQHMAENELRRKYLHFSRLQAMTSLKDGAKTRLTELNDLRQDIINLERLVEFGGGVEYLECIPNTRDFQTQGIAVTGTSVDESRLQNTSISPSVPRSVRDGCRPKKVSNQRDARLEERRVERRMRRLQKEPSVPSSSPSPSPLVVQLSSSLVKTVSSDDPIVERGDDVSASDRKQCASCHDKNVDESQNFLDRFGIEQLHDAYKDLNRFGHITPSNKKASECHHSAVEKGLRQKPVNSFAPVMFDDAREPPLGASGRDIRDHARVSLSSRRKRYDVIAGRWT